MTWGPSRDRQSRQDRMTNDPLDAWVLKWLFAIVVFVVAAGMLLIIANVIREFGGDPALTFALALALLIAVKFRDDLDSL